MNILRIRLCDEDRAALDAPEWLELDVEQFKDLTAEQVQALDMALGFPVAVFVPILEDSRLSKAGQVRRFAVWAALRLDGRDDLSWADCNPKVLRAEFVLEERGGPPAGPSGSSSEDVPPASS